MSNLDVERRLTEVLHRHAEDAMTSTDTQTELREFLSRGDQEPPRTRESRRGLAALGAGTAAAIVAGLVIWSPDLTAERERPAPVQEPTPAAVQVAEEFVTAYATNDTVTVRSLAADEALFRSWRLYMARDAAWAVQYLFEPCRAITEIPEGTGVVCAFAGHVLHSEDLGRGPFENAYFSVWVDEDGKVFDADPTWNHENNGLQQHVEAVYQWVVATHPEDAELLEKDEPDVPAKRLDRWLTLWERYSQEYVDAHS